MRIAFISIFSVYIFFNASCASHTEIREYPKEWAKLKNKTTTEHCPNISGYYNYLGKTPRGQTSTLQCTYLSVQLLSPHVPERTKTSVVPHCKEVISGGNIVELRQPEKNKLKIYIWAKIKNNENMDQIAEQTLSMEDGDFTCEDGFLILKKRTQAFFIILGSNSGSEIRSFNNSKGGWLVMKSDFQTIGHVTIFGYKSKEVYWVKWEKIAE